MKTRVNETTGVNEGLIEATVISINESDVKTNANGKDYLKAMVQITYPDGEKAQIQTIMYAKAKEALPDVYKVGGVGEIAVQLEGEYAGNSVFQAKELIRIDLTKFGVAVAQATPQAEGVPAVTA